MIINPYKYAVGGGGGNGLLTGLVSYYKLDEASGSALDAHSSNNLTENGTAGTTTGIINGSRSSAGGANYFSLASPTAFQNASVSWSGWIRFTSISAYMTPGGLTNGGAWTEGYGFYVEGGVLKWFVNSYSTDPAVSAALSTGVTYHFVGTFDDSTKDLKLYINGSLVDTKTRSVSVAYTSVDLKLMFLGTGTNLDGWVDESAFWSRALSSTDVTAIYNAGACLPYGSYTS